MVGKIEEIIELRRQHRDPDAFNVRSIDTLCDEVERLRRIEDAALDWASEPSNKSDQARSELRLAQELDRSPRPGAE